MKMYSFVADKISLLFWVCFFCVDLVWEKLRYRLYSKYILAAEEVLIDVA